MLNLDYMPLGSIDINSPRGAEFIKRLGKNPNAADNETALQYLMAGIDPGSRTPIEGYQGVYSKAKTFDGTPVVVGTTHNGMVDGKEGFWSPVVTPTDQYAGQFTNGETALTPDMLGGYKDGWQVLNNRVFIAPEGAPLVEPEFNKYTKDWLDNPMIGALLTFGPGALLMGAGVGMGAGAAAAGTGTGIGTAAAQGALSGAGAAAGNFAGSILGGLDLAGTAAGGGSMFGLGDLFSGLGDTTADVFSGALQNAGMSTADAVALGTEMANAGVPLEALEGIVGNMTPSFMTEVQNLAGRLGVNPTRLAGQMLSGNSGAAGGMNLGGLLGGLLGASGLGNGKEAGKTTMTQEPWSPMQPYLIDAAKKLQGNFNTTTPDYLKGMFEGFQGNLGNLQGMASMGMSGAFDPFLPNVNYSADPIGVNDYAGKVMDSISNRMTKTLTEDVLPQIRSGAVANGYGSSRQGIAEGRAISDFQQNLADAMAQPMFGAYENYANRMQQNNQFNSNLGLSIGNQNIAAAQAALNNRIAPTQAANQGYGMGWQMGDQYNNYGFNQANNYANSMARLGGLGGQSSQPYYTNPMGNLVGGAMLGNQLWRAF